MQAETEQKQETNGGYSKDKRYIDECLKKNEDEHKTMMELNSQAHDEIKGMLKEVRDVYIPNVVSNTTKITILSWGLGVCFTGVIGFLIKLVLDHFASKS